MKLIYIGGGVIMLSIMIIAIILFFIIMNFILPTTLDQQKILWVMWSYCWKIFLVGFTCIAIGSLPILIKDV